MVEYAKVDAGLISTVFRAGRATCNQLVAMLAGLL
jgi:hypothetical protein